jgi:hypothetical protein
VMERELPTGRGANKLEIVARERPREFAIRTTSGPTPFHYLYRFSAKNGETVVQLTAEVELQGPAAFVPQFARRVVPQFARRAVKKGADHNFATLKEILEAASAGRPTTSTGSRLLPR